MAALVWFLRAVFAACVAGVLAAAARDAYGLAFLFFCLSCWAWGEIGAAKRCRALEQAAEGLEG